MYVRRFICGILFVDVVTGSRGYQPQESAPLAPPRIESARRHRRSYQRGSAVGYLTVPDVLALPPSTKIQQQRPDGSG